MKFNFGLLFFSLFGWKIAYSKIEHPSLNYASIEGLISRILGELLLVSHTVEPVRSGSRSHTIW